MIGSLPTALEIDGREYAIHSDFRVILRIYSAFADPELDEREKCYVPPANALVGYPQRKGI